MSLQYSLVNQVLYAMAATITAKSLKDKKPTHVSDQKIKCSNYPAPSVRKHLSSGTNSYYPQPNFFFALIGKKQFIIVAERAPQAELLSRR